MSEENLDALRRIYDGWAAGDFGVEASLFDPHMVGVFPDPSPVPLYGLDAVTGYMREFLKNWESIRFEANAYRDAGDSVLVQVRRSGIGQRSGVSLQDDIFQLWTFRGGRVIRLDVFAQEAEALEAAGLSE